MTDAELCDLTDLVPDQCGCRRHRGGKTPDEEARGELAAWGLAFAAQYAGRCVLCGEAIEVGDPIRRAGRYGDGGYAHECCP